MSEGRKRRTLTPEERALWNAIRRTARPLRNLTEAAHDGDAAPPSPAKAKPQAPSPSRRVAQRPAVPPTPGPLDHKTRSRLARGAIPVDARLDLHGLSQARAHDRLLRFLEASQARDARLVLVITGKGAPEARGGAGAPERGVLRRAVPDWLESAGFRHLVAGFGEAGRRHGGEGAVYVRIRRRRRSGWSVG